jgi:hypothetical protein
MISNILEIGEAFMALPIFFIYIILRFSSLLFPVVGCEDGCGVDELMKSL